MLCVAGAVALANEGASALVRGEIVAGDFDWGLPPLGRIGHIEHAASPQSMAVTASLVAVELVIGLVLLRLLGGPDRSGPRGWWVNPLGVGMGLVIGGGLGNACEWLLSRSVTDFISFGPGSPGADRVYDLADLCLYAGVAVLAVVALGGLRRWVTAPAVRSGAPYQGEQLVGPTASPCWQDEAPPAAR